MNVGMTQLCIDVISTYFNQLSNTKPTSVRLVNKSDTVLLKYDMFS